MFQTMTIQLLLLYLHVAAILSMEAQPLTINMVGSCPNADNSMQKRLEILEAMVNRQQDQLAKISENRTPDVIRGRWQIYIL